MVTSNRPTILPRVSRQLYNETWSLLYECNTFEFRKYGGKESGVFCAWNYFNTLKPWQQEQIRSVTVVIGELDFFDARTWALLCGAMRGLRELTCVLDCDGFARGFCDGWYGVEDAWKWLGAVKNLKHLRRLELKLVRCGCTRNPMEELLDGLTAALPGVAVVVTNGTSKPPTDAIVDMSIA
jgi:hypothetical protein